VIVFCFVIRLTFNATHVFAEGYHGAHDEKSEQIRFGIVVRNVGTAHRSRADRQAISVGKGLGAARLVRSDVERDQIELWFKHCVID